MEKRGTRGLVVPSLLALSLVVACGKKEEAPAAGAAAGTGAPAAGAVTQNPVDAATAGNIHGMVKFTGAVPKAAAVDMSSEPECQKARTTPLTTEDVVSSGGNLANVFVYVKDGLDKSLKFPAGDPVTLDQQGCQYHPHVIAMSAGQTLNVKNSDPFLHNINAQPSTNRGFNRSQPNQGMEFQTQFTTPEVMVPVKCDVHGWMSAFIGVTDNPYHAMSGQDGAFTLDRLPPGTYTLEAWHEKFGTATQQVTVETGKTAEVTFTFDGKKTAMVPMGPALVVDHHTGTLRRESAGTQQ